MPLPTEQITPLREFLERHQGQAREDFLKAIRGPLLMFRFHKTPAMIIDLGRLSERQQALLIGRKEDCDLRFEDGAISGHHARLEVTGGRWRLVDLGSTNGTFGRGRFEPNKPEALSDAVKYHLAEVVKIQFWQAITFYRELRDRHKVYKNTRRGRQLTRSNDQAARLLTTRRVFRGRQNGQSRDLLRLAAEIKGMSASAYRDYHPCPFLLQLSIADPGTGQDSSQTEVSIGWAPNSGFDDIRYWPIASREGAEEIILGRGPESDIQVEHPTISMVHATIIIDERRGSYVLEDAGSRNGILFDGEAIVDPTVLKDEATFRLGRGVLVQYMEPETLQRFANLYRRTHK